MKEHPYQIAVRKKTFSEVFRLDGQSTQAHTHDKQSLHVRWKNASHVCSPRPTIQHQNGACTRIRLCTCTTGRECSSQCCMPAERRGESRAISLVPPNIFFRGASHKPHRKSGKASFFCNILERGKECWMTTCSFGQPRRRKKPHQLAADKKTSPALLHYLPGIHHTHTHAELG